MRQSMIFEGLKILDLQTTWLAPWQALCSLTTAKVIKIERPVSGDDTGWWGSGEIDGYSWYLWLNRGKKPVTISLTDPTGLNIIKR